MHEISIMQGALDLALQTAQASASRQILCLRLRVGAMTGVVPDALQFAFEALREGTIAAEARLEVEMVPLACWCADCQKEFASHDWRQDCPTCGRSSAEMRRGLELELASLDVA
jgi:hydrogenase nickel incorporation protein HypA/HybF